MGTPYCEAPNLLLLQPPAVCLRHRGPGSCHQRLLPGHRPPGRPHQGGGQGDLVQDPPHLQTRNCVLLFPHYLLQFSLPSNPDPLLRPWAGRPWPAGDDPLQAALLDRLLGLLLHCYIQLRLLLFPDQRGLLHGLHRGQHLPPAAPRGQHQQHQGQTFGASLRLHRRLSSAVLLVEGED